VHYTPWLNFSLIRDGDGTLLDLACCTVASRHLSPSFRPHISPRLQKLADEKISKLILNPQTATPLEAIQSLLILALYAPLSSGMRDGRVLIASAAKIAVNLQLNEASTKLIQSKAMGATDEQLAELVNQARLVGCILDHSHTNALSVDCLNER
jgi:hypothetical protein